MWEEALTQTVNTPKCEERGFGVTVCLLPMAWSSQHDMYRWTFVPWCCEHLSFCWFWNLLLLTCRDIFFFSQCASGLVCGTGVLIAHSWPHFAESFSAAEFSAPGCNGSLEEKGSNWTALINSSDSWFPKRFPSYSVFLCYIKENLHTFPFVFRQQAWIRLANQ